MLLFVLLLSFPLLVFTNSATLFIPREEASYRFKEGELLENEDRITVSTGWLRYASPINVTLYTGCDIPLLLQVVPDEKWVHLWQRVNGKYKRRHTIQDYRPNKVSDKFDLQLRYMDGNMNIHVNDVAEQFDAYQFRWEVPMDKLTRVVVHGQSTTGTNIKVDHKRSAMAELARNEHAKMRGPNF